MNQPLHKVWQLLALTLSVHDKELSGFIDGKLKQKGAQGSASHESKHRSTPWAAGLRVPGRPPCLQTCPLSAQRPTWLSLLITRDNWLITG